MKRSFLCLQALILFCAVAAISANAESLPLSVKANISVSSDDPVRLIFTVSNDTAAPVYLRANIAPWHAVYRTVFLFYSDSCGLIAPEKARSVAIAEELPIGLSEKIPAKSQITRTVLVGDYFAGLNDLLKSGDVLMFWELRLEIYNDDPFAYNGQGKYVLQPGQLTSRFGGFLEILKGRSLFAQKK